ncbi:MAG: hypothetical protein L0H26_07685 [Microlunatus sp.]|nr:hypothetical protein [Microlunatus sp.]
MPSHVDGFDHPAATRIQPGWRGERFNPHEAVHVLFRMRIPEEQTQDAAKRFVRSRCTCRLAEGTG